MKNALKRAEIGRNWREIAIKCRESLGDEGWEVEQRLRG
jgi:hypothetical protein